MRGDDGDDGDEAIRFGLSCDPSLFRDPTGCPDQAPPGTGAWILPKPHGRGQIDPDRIMQGRYRTQPPPRTPELRQVGQPRGPGRLDDGKIPRWVNCDHRRHRAGPWRRRSAPAVSMPRFISISGTGMTAGGWRPCRKADPPPQIPCRPDLWHHPLHRHGAQEQPGHLLDDNRTLVPGLPAPRPKRPGRPRPGLDPGPLLSSETDAPDRARHQSLMVSFAEIETVCITAKIPWNRR